MKGFNGTISSSAPPDPDLLNITAATLGIRSLCLELPTRASAPQGDVLAQLDECWQGRGKDALFDRAAAHFANLLSAQIKRQQQLRVINAQNAARLQALLSDVSGTHVHGITVTDEQGDVIELHGAYLLGTPHPAESESPPYQPQFFVWLWTPGKGIEQFPTLGWLTDALLRRLGSQDKTQVLMEHPPGVVGQDYGSATLGFDAVQVELGQHMATRFAAYQRAQVAAALEDEEADVEQAYRLRGLNDSLGAHLLKHLQDYHVRTLPDWLRLASADERQAYRDAETALSTAQHSYDSQFKDLSTNQAYARQQVIEFLRREASIELDPELETVQTAFDLQRKTAAEQVNESMSLVEFALQELTSAYLDITVDPELQDKGVTTQLLWKMHGQLNARIRYYSALKQHYKQPSTLQQLADVLSLRLALTLLAARYQGLVDDSLLEPVESARAAPAKPFGADVRVGNVQVHKRKIPLRDLLIFGIGEGSSQRLMLYAPGSPAGRDIFVFDSERQMNIEISSWIVTQAGRRYLTAQVPVAHRARSRRGLEQVARRPGGRC